LTKAASDDISEWFCPECVKEKTIQQEMEKVLAASATADISVGDAAPIPESASISATTSEAMDSEIGNGIAQQAGTADNTTGIVSANGGNTNAQHSQPLAAAAAIQENGHTNGPVIHITRNSVNNANSIPTAAAAEASINAISALEEVAEYCFPAPDIPGEDRCSMSDTFDTLWPPLGFDAHKFAHMQQQQWHQQVQQQQHGGANDYNMHPQDNQHYNQYSSAQGQGEQQYYEQQQQQQHQQVPAIANAALPMINPAVVAMDEERVAVVMKRPLEVDAREQQHESNGGSDKRVKNNGYQGNSYAM
jgi:hypothetical protein